MIEKRRESKIFSSQTQIHGQNSTEMEIFFFPVCFLADTVIESVEEVANS